jgi:hypothetical protein
MKDALERAFAQQAAAKAKPVAKATPAPRKAPTATPAARHWGAPDPGYEYRMPAPAPAPQAKQSGLDKNMVTLLAQNTRRDSR